MNKVMIALGANTPGTWGTPRAALRCALIELNRAGVRIIAASPLYRTKPVGQTRQPAYLNAVVLGATALPPNRLLRLLKRLERAAGRQSRLAGAARPLDLDLIDHGRRVIGWPSRRRSRGRIVLPHPEAHWRAFVLVPLVDVAPHWVHPALKLPARSLLFRIPRQRGDATKLDTAWCCILAACGAKD